MAASLVRPEDVNLMAARGRGLICCALDTASAGRLALSVQGDSLHDTAFTASVDYRHGTSTGISCADRAAGLRALADPASRPADFARPGHLFPLVARPGGVLERRGHTEAAVDLCRLAGLPPAGVICEIMNDDGTMARGPQLEALARELGMPFLRVEDIARHRAAADPLPVGPARPGLSVAAQARLPTPWGEFTLSTLGHPGNPGASGEHQAPLVLSLGLPLPGGCAGSHAPRAGQAPASASAACRSAGAQPSPPLVRVHSACLTGELFGSLRCDCGPQLDAALARIGEEGRGALVYLHQEGRGIGLEAKLAAYGLQDQGLDTHDANLALGYPADARDYRQAVEALRLFGLDELRLLTNNPEKVRALEAGGIRVSARVGLTVGANPHNRQYLETKRLRFGHQL
jgi:3,4-dihydroxy 2-butanone 4-phosphate synthase/GTP cyclohydrolase II